MEATKVVFSPRRCCFQEQRFSGNRHVAKIAMDQTKCCATVAWFPVEFCPPGPQNRRKTGQEHVARAIVKAKHIITSARKGKKEGLISKRLKSNAAWPTIGRAPKSRRAGAKACLSYLITKKQIAGAKSKSRRKDKAALTLSYAGIFCQKHLLGMKVFGPLFDQPVSSSCLAKGMRRGSAS